jgi:dipeptidyl aminopeptidase/acylaminoacyl peptidase
MVAEVSGGGWSVLDWSPDGGKLLLREAISVNESYLSLLDLASGTRTPLTPRAAGAGEKVAYGERGRFAPDGKSLYVTTDRGSEFLRLARVRIADGGHTYLTERISWDVETFDLSRDGHRLAAVVNENGVGRLRLFDAGSGRERRPPPLPPGSVSAVGWHGGSRDLAFTLTSVKTSADVFVLGGPGGRVERWTESEIGGVDIADLPEPELVQWQSFDGRTLSGILYRPASRFAGRRPVMVSIHGGPEAQARPAFQGRNNYLLAELGVAILYPNVRGSTGYGKSFTKLDNGLLREDTVKDIGALLEWIGRRPDLDPDRIMVSGGSYGGYMSLAVAAHYSDRIRCAVDVVGISNFVTFLERTEAYRRDLRRVEYGDERDPEVRAFLERIAPVKNAHKIKKPMLVAQGQNDPRVPLHEAEQIVTTLRKQGTPVWYLLARDEGHGFNKKKNADYLFYALVAFMQKYLLD